MRKIAAISSEVATGRRMNCREGFTAGWPSSELRRAVPAAAAAAVAVAVGNRWRRRRWLADDGDACIVLQLVEAAVGDDFSGLDAIQLRHAGIRDARFYVANVRDAVLDDVDVG